MTPPGPILTVAISLGLVILGIAFLLTVFRVVRGPTLADRVVALDMLVGIVIGFIAVIAIRTGFTLYIDIAISLGLVGFLATVAFARFILVRGENGSVEGDAPASTEAAAALAAGVAGGAKKQPKRQGRGQDKAQAKRAAREAGGKDPGGKGPQGKRPDGKGPEGKRKTK